MQSTHIDAYARKKIAEKDRYTDRDPGMPPNVEKTSLRNDPSGSEKMVKRPCYSSHQRRIHHLQERYNTFRRTATIKHKLHRSDPFKPGNCKCENCLVCQTGGNGNCETEGVTYKHRMSRMWSRRSGRIISWTHIAEHLHPRTEALKGFGPEARRMCFVEACATQTQKLRT